MKTLTGAERIFKALQLQEPDRVPFYEGPNKKIQEEIFPGSSYDDAVKYFDLDAVIVDDRKIPGYLVEALDGSRFRNQWGTIVRATSESLVHPMEGAIKTEEDLKNQPYCPETEQLTWKETRTPLLQQQLHMPMTMTLNHHYHHSSMIR